MTVVSLVESTKLAEAATAGVSKRFRARLIEGDIWGSSGYYSRQVLESAATAKVFGTGVPIFIDHPGAEERFDRPERSVRDLAGKLVTDALYETDGLYADIEIYSHFAPLVESMAADIGMSIRANGTVEQGEAGGRTGTIITALEHAESVDFVTRAGAGGKVVSLLESARVNNRAIHRGVSEATVNDRREALSALVREQYSDDKTYVWLRDFDDTNAWFDVEAPDETGTWQQTYTTGDDDLANALTGDRVEVRPVITYVPVIPAGQFTTQESSGGHMATTPIEESELARLREDAGRVNMLESERDAAVKERDEAVEKATASEALVRESRISAIIAEADVKFDDLQVAGLTVGAPIKEGALDEDAFKKTVAEAAAKIAEANGAGSVRGFGGNTGPVDKTEQVLRESNDKQRAGIFGRTIKEA